MDTAAKRTAVTYYRTSSATNVGADKDSLPRQQDAVQAYAAANGIEVVHEFYDAAVSGADPVMSRPGFADMLAYMLGNGARTVLVENASRFARDLAVQIAGHDLLKGHGITLVPVDAPNHFLDETPTATMVRSILGAVSQFEKEALVMKLRKARERKRRDTGRCEGNPAWKPVPEATVKAARDAHGRGLTLRAVSAELAAAGFVSPSGKAYGAQSVKRMVTRPS
ncbi:MAG TPA: recombinase family protein [Steroidobacteraceae bacterium]|jgi:DNA invertase Pin-like site-specific DNA recombinase|nr:recombinase family protein [Steroidobacteraceae bacterium]